MPGTRQRGAATWTRLAPLVAAAAALAGCLGPGAPEAAPGAGSGSGPDAGDARALPEGIPGALALLGCREFHAFYATPWAAWAPMMPEGFGPDGTDPTGSLTALYQHVSLCRAEDPGQSGTAVDAAVAWTGVRVTPPPALAVDGALVHAVPLDLVAHPPWLAAAYRAWGLGDLVREGTVEVTSTGAAGAADAGTVEVRREGASYALAYAVGPGGEGSVAGAGRVFAVAGDPREVIGWFDYTWPSWTEVGLGSVAYTGEGDAAAPPAYPGTIHQVRDVDLAVAYAVAPPR